MLVVRRARQALRRRVANRRAGSHRFAAFGHGSTIVPPATVLAPHRVEIGAGVVIFERATLSLVEEFRGRRHEPRLRIGDGTLVGRDAWFSCVGTIDVGRDVMIGHNVLIADSFHEYEAVGTPVFHQPMAPPRDTRVGDGAILGPGAALLSGTTVGAGAYVVANAVVSGHVPAHSVVAGNPAELIRSWDGERWVDSDDPRWAALLGSLTR